MDLELINERRDRRDIPQMRFKPLKLNINGRRFRSEEINIAVSQLYMDDVSYDIDWSYPEIFDPFKRSKKHMELFNEDFGLGRANQVRFDHFLERTHICDGLKWLNRAYQLLDLGGVLTISVLDFYDLFARLIKTKTITSGANKFKPSIEKYERLIFVDTDPSGMYYNRTIWTPERFDFYLKESFFYEYEIVSEYNEIFMCNVINVRAIKDTIVKTEIAPDGALKEVK